MRSTFKKIFLLIFLISILSVLCINFYKNHEMYTTFSTSGLNESEVQKAYTATGKVVDQKNYGFDIADENNVLVHVISSNKPNTGDHVEILGIMEPSGYFKSIKVVKISKWGDESLILRSLLGLILITVIFFKYWRFNLKNFEFVRLKK